MRRRKLVIFLAAIALLGCWASFAPLLATRLIVEHSLETADVIVVLSGSASYKERTKLAAALFAQGKAKGIVISDDGGRAGWSQSEQTNLPFVELARRELMIHGVPQEAIIQLPGLMTGTDSEAKAFAAFSDERQIRSVLLVTSPYHTRRAYDTFIRALSSKEVQVGICSAPLGPRSPEPELWWLRRAGWRNVAGEYVKSVAYWLFY